MSYHPDEKAEAAYRAWGGLTPFFQLNTDERRLWFDVVAAVEGWDERLEIAVRKAIDDAVTEAMPDAFDIAEKVRAAIALERQEVHRQDA